MTSSALAKDLVLVLILVITASCEEPPEDDGAEDASDDPDDPTGPLEDALSRHVRLEAGLFLPVGPINEHGEAPGALAGYLELGGVVVRFGRLILRGRLFDGFAAVERFRRDQEARIAHELVSFRPL